MKKKLGEVTLTTCYKDRICRVFIRLHICVFCILCFAPSFAQPSLDPLKWTAQDELTASQAKQRFEMVFSSNPEMTFAESPLSGWFVSEDRSGGLSLFNADITLIGMGDSWKIRRGRQLGNLPLAEARMLRQSMTKLVRPDALVPSWQNESNSKSGAMNVIFTAPNCPACQALDSNLTNAGTSIVGRIGFVPGLLGGSQANFYTSVICSADPQQTFKTAFAQKGRIRLEVPTGCSKRTWGTILENIFFPSEFGKLTFSYPSIFNAQGQKIVNVTWTSSAEANRALSR